MNRLKSIITITATIVCVALTVIATYGYFYEWAPIVYVTHDEIHEYLRPITVFEWWKDGIVIHRSFLLVPTNIGSPSLTALTYEDGKDPLVWQSATGFWLVVGTYLFGWFSVGRKLLAKRKQSNQAL